MRKYFSLFFKLVVLSSLISIISFSCINQKNVTYFNNLGDSAYISLDSLKAPQQVIQVNDVLELRIGGENEKTVQYISGYLGGAGGGASAGGAAGGGAGGMQLVVDVNGNVDLPKAGKIKVAGLTRDEARDTIKNAYSEYLQDPIVNLTLSTFKFTILGEVRTPGLYSSLNERINIFEAIAMAGDMTQYAKKNDVKIIRQDAFGKREVITINFNDKSILNSPYYYINRYDVIYVQPVSVKILGDNTSRTTTIIGTISTILALFILLFKK
jgi:polysaccharide export outer membrane protein